MKSAILAAAILLVPGALAQAQQPYYFQPYYSPPVNYHYNYFYLNPQPGFPNGMAMYNYRVQPQYYQYNYGYPTYYQFGNGFRW